MAEAATGTARPRTPSRWAKGSVVGEWYKSWRGHMRRDGLTLDLAAKLLERELRRTRGMDRAVAMVKAKRCTFWLKRAGAHANACADNLDRFWRSYEEHFVAPKQQRASGEHDPNA